MAAEHYDIVVIGTGPAGEAAAMNAKKKGANVAAVCDLPQVGGACTHLGTIPSKALRHGVKQLMQFNSNPMFRDFGDLNRISFPELIKQSEKVIYEQVKMRTGFYERNFVPMYKGTASFLDANTIRLGSKGQQLTADHFIIATGARPYHPPEVDFSHPLGF